MTNMRIRIAVWDVLLMFLCSCSQEKQPASAEQWMDTNKIKPQPTRQSTLTDEQLARIRKAQAMLAEVDHSSLAKWIEDFEKDRNPEREIRKWEFIGAAYQTYSSAHVLTLQAKKEVFGILLLRSGTSNETEILRQANLQALTAKQAQEVMADYKGEAQPIEVELK